MYLIYLMAGAIRIPNGSDKSDTSVSLSFLNTKLTKLPFLLCFPCSKKMKSLRLCASAFDKNHVKNGEVLKLRHFYCLYRTFCSSVKRTVLRASYCLFHRLCGEYATNDRSFLESHQVGYTIVYSMT